MGVCGCGKSTIGKFLAERLGGTFLDADSLHTLENIDKMSQGISLDDYDRWPWLDAVSRAVEGFDGSSPLILACSALKQSYRDRLALNQCQIVFLKGTREILEQRLSSRSNHYMTSQLLDSQLECLQEPKNAMSISIDTTPVEILKQIVRALR
jgi:gluconokinase